MGLKPPFNSLSLDARGKEKRNLLTPIYPLSLEGEGGGEGGSRRMIQRKNTDAKTKTFVDN